jgi:hypothetical protein
MRVLFFICVLFFYNQISAQNCVADTVCVKKVTQSSDCEKDSRDFFYLNVEAIGSEYDMIYDYIYPDYVIAVREDKFYKINVHTYEEKLIESKRYQGESPRGGREFYPSRKK